MLIRLAKIHVVLWQSQLDMYSLVNGKPLASHNPINGVNEEKEGRNGRERSKRGRYWTNRKERDKFGDGWYCCLLAIILS